MDPYRTAPEPEVEPNIDRLPVMVRGGIVRGGTVIVTPRTLRWKPRFGRARTCPIASGLDGLALSKALDVVNPEPRMEPVIETVTTWMKIVASGPYERGLARTPHRVLEAFQDYINDDQDYESKTEYAIVLEADRAVAIASGRAVFTACFGELDWPEASARTLRRALAWLSPNELTAATARIRKLEKSRWVRTFSRDEVRAGRGDYEGRLVFGFGPADYERVLLRPERDDLSILEDWLG